MKTDIVQVLGGLAYYFKHMGYRDIACLVLHGVHEIRWLRAKLHGTPILPKSRQH